MKRIIQMFSMLVLATVLFAVSAQAQSTDRIDAKIPFDFSIGSKSFKAGDYVLKVSKSETSGSTFQLVNKKGKVLESGTLSENGETSKESSRLIFEQNSDKQNFLSKVMIDNKGFSLSPAGGSESLTKSDSQ